MAMQANVIVVSLVELNVFGFWNTTEILDIDVAQATHLGSQSAVHRIVSVAGVTRLLWRNAVILEMRRRDVALVIDVEASAEIPHNVAREAECGLLRTLQGSEAPPQDAITGKAKNATKISALPPGALASSVLKATTTTSSMLIT